MILQLISAYHTTVPYQVPAALLQQVPAEVELRAQSNYRHRDAGLPARCMVAEVVSLAVSRRTRWLPMRRARRSESSQVGHRHAGHRQGEVVERVVVRLQELLQFALASVAAGHGAGRKSGQCRPVVGRRGRLAVAGDLYHMLVMLTRKSALAEVRRVDDDNGTAACRLLLQRYEPSELNRSLGFLSAGLSSPARTR